MKKIADIAIIFGAIIILLGFSTLMASCVEKVENLNVENRVDAKDLLGNKETRCAFVEYSKGEYHVCMVDCEEYFCEESGD